MSKQKKESFFWTSFSDLMTSLFFVMLVLFVLTIALLHKKMVQIEKERIATQEQLDQINRLNESVKNIDKRYFLYDEVFKRHTLNKIDVSFKTGSSNINDISSDKQKQLVLAGRAIRKFIDDAIKINQTAKYLLIIEGQSSKDNYNKDIFYNNYVLSYQRALELVKLWSINNIIFEDSNCEVIISGSGQSSPYRLQPDIWSNKANQRFVIHIIPKPGIIEASKNVNEK